MRFQILETLEQLNKIDALSASKLQIIFKHSTRCSVSFFSKRILEEEIKEISNDNDIDIYYLDLIRYRTISNTIEERYNIRHESPQLLLIQKGKCIYDASHSAVSLKRALERTDNRSR